MKPTEVPDHLFRSSDADADKCDTCGGEAIQPNHVKIGDPRIVWDANGFRLREFPKNEMSILLI